MYRLIIAIFALFANADAIAQEILVITDRSHPVYAIPATARQIHLDAVQSQEDVLSAGLPSGQNQAIEAARLRLNPRQHQQLATAFQGIVDAWALGIQKIPAVVVDHRYVIYGEQDVQKALSRIEAYREAQP